jgi:hypothetical protein
MRRQRMPGLVPGSRDMFSRAIGLVEFDMIGRSS